MSPLSNRQAKGTLLESRQQGNVLLQLSILSFSHKIHVPRNVNTP
jgi:hypothetical protein